VVKGVSPREAIYNGPYLDNAPDLVIDWDFSVLADSLSYPVGQEQLTIDPPRRTGSGQRWNGGHHPQGVLIAHGLPIRQAATLANAHIYDIAPTILYLQNRRVPREMDGRVLTDLFAREHVQCNPVRLGKPASTEVQSNGPVLDPKDERIVEKRLRDLGYIG
jgi:predicted AlkP superfamily phosphohydrolase/phosphomutase